MSTVTINGVSYTLPTHGFDAPWGEQQAALLNAIVTALNSLSSSTDILESSFIIPNTSGATNVTGLLFSSASVRSFQCEYNIHRSIVKAISAIATGAGTVQITTTGAHYLRTGDSVTLSGTNSTPTINSTYTVTVTGTTTFTISETVTVAGSAGAFTSYMSESGIILGCYDTASGWQISQMITDGDAQVALTINASGQIQSNSTVLVGSSHSGLMKFKASTLSVS